MYTVQGGCLGSKIRSSGGGRGVVGALFAFPGGHVGSAASDGGPHPARDGFMHPTGRPSGRR